MPYIMKKNRDNDGRTVNHYSGDSIAKNQMKKTALTVRKRTFYLKVGKRSSKLCVVPLILLFRNHKFETLKFTTVFRGCLFLPPRGFYHIAYGRNMIFKPIRQYCVNDLNIIRPNDEIVQRILIT